MGARWLVELEALDRAARLLTWHEAIRWGATNPEEWINRMLEPLAILERARIEKVQGRYRHAAGHYAEFLERFDRPVSALTGLRTEADAARRASLQRTVDDTVRMTDPETARIE